MLKGWKNGLTMSSPSFAEQGGDVAIKREYSENPSFQSRFMREAVLGRRLNHRNIVKCHPCKEVETGLGCQILNRFLTLGNAGREVEAMIACQILNQFIELEMTTSERIA